MEPHGANGYLISQFLSSTGVPIAPVDEATYYQGGDAGYLTYPAYQFTA